jgi:hypothetical protein
MEIVCINRGVSLKAWRRYDKTNKTCEVFSLRKSGFIYYCNSNRLVLLLMLTTLI